MGRSLAWVCLTAFLGTACDSAGPPTGSQVTDSAGLRIVTNDRTERGGGEWLRVDADPALSIGTLDGSEAEQLFRVTDATRLPDGRIVVLNAGSSEVRFFGADGTHLRSIGGNGAGPGEFQNPVWIRRLADTLVVFDPFQDNGRATYLDLEGELLATHRLATEERRFPSPSTVLPDGTFLDAGGEGSIGPNEVGHVRFTHVPLRYPPSGAPVDTIATVPGSELFRSTNGTFVQQTDVPFGREAFTAAGEDRVYVGNGDAAAVEAFDFSGRHLLSIRFPEDRHAVTPELVDRWIEVRLESSVPDDQPDALQRAREAYAAPPVPSTMPAHGELLVDEAQRLWVRRYVPPWDPTHQWMVFGSDGRWLGDVNLPLDLQVLEIGDGYLLGVARDELSVESLRLHRWTLAGDA